MLGLVGEPDVPEHQNVCGWLSIPYWTRAGVVAIRFRRMPVDRDRQGNFVFADGPKYMSIGGDTKRLYNPEALFVADESIAVCEGELDTIAMNELVGFPAVGIPGVSGWTPAMHRALEGFDRVFVVLDGDEAGRQAAQGIAASMAGRAIVVDMPEKWDVNALAVARGKEAVLERMGVG